MPTLVIHGDADRIVPIGASGARMPKMIKGARLVQIGGAPHVLLWTHGEEVNRALLEFLGSGRR